MNEEVEAYYKKQAKELQYLQDQISTLRVEMFNAKHHTDAWLHRLDGQYKPYGKKGE